MDKQSVTLGDLYSSVLEERECLYARIGSLERDQRQLSEAILWMASRHSGQTLPRRIRLAITKAKRRLSRFESIRQRIAKSDAAA